MQNELRNLILKNAPAHLVKAVAPNTAKDLFGLTSMVVWSGESDNTIWGDARVNWAFRAIHDTLHLKTGLGFSPAEEIELGRIQAAQYSSQFMQDLVYIETAGQASEYLRTGKFVSDQVAYTLRELNKLGYALKAG